MTKQIRNPRATCKTPAFCTFQSPFPLTRSLSLREREHHRQCIRQPESLGLGAKPSLVHPLPEGEGRGEGEQSLQIRERCGFCNHLPSLKEADAVADSDFVTGHCFGLRHLSSIIRLCLAAALLWAIAPLITSAAPSTLHFAV